MRDSIVVKRLVRNLRYRQTYIRAFESFLQPEPQQDVVRLLHVLIAAQQSAVVLLTGYLRGLGVGVPDRPVEKLMDHASSRKDVRSRLWFIRYGLTRAASWYGEQLVDRQMTADSDLKRLLFELGESEASGLWRTQMVMDRLGIRDEAAPEVLSRIVGGGPVRTGYRRPGVIDGPRRPAWNGERRSTGRRRPGAKRGG